MAVVAVKFNDEIWHQNEVDIPRNPSWGVSEKNDFKYIDTT